MHRLPARRPRAGPPRGTRPSGRVVTTSGLVQHVGQHYTPLGTTHNPRHVGRANGARDWKTTVKEDVGSEYISRV